MDQQEPEIDSLLRTRLRQGREIRPVGFADRAMAAVHRDVVRRRLIRWSTPLAACAALLALALGTPASLEPPSQHDLAQLLSLHDQVILTSPRIDDADALAALAVDAFEAAAGMPRLEGADEALARIVLGS